MELAFRVRAHSGYGRNHFISQMIEELGFKHGKSMMESFQ